MGEQAVILILK